MEAKAHLKYLRISPRKVKLAADVIRGLNVKDAAIQLKSLTKRSSDPMEKLLNSAIANAENNFGISRSNLSVSEIFVNEGPTLKRWMPRAMGRATQILKRTSHVTIVLDEIESTSQKSVKSKVGDIEKAGTKETGEIKEIKKLSDKKIFERGKQAGIKGSQNIDMGKKFQRRKAI